MEHFRNTFKLLEENQLYAKLSKCAGKVSYLGHIISEQGVATDPNKIEAAWTDSIGWGAESIPRAHRLLQEISSRLRDNQQTTYGSEQ